MAKRIIACGLAVVLAVGMLAGCADKQQNTPPVTSEPASTPTQELPVGMVTVYAGSLIPGVQGGLAAQAQMLKPYGLCATADGSLLVVDSYANQLREVVDGQVRPLAGNIDASDSSGYPLGGYLDGAAAEAVLNRPRFAAVAGDGSVVFTDSENHRVRVLYQGDVLLLAGGGTPGFANGDFRMARFNMPSGVEIDADGTVYVADTLNHCIRAISPEGVVSTLAGVPGTPGLQDGSADEALFCEPNDIELGPDGALYIVDKGNQRLRKLQKGQIQTVAGSGTEQDSATGYIIGGYRDGAASDAQFLYPTGLSVAGDGTVYLADTGNNCVRQITSDGQVSTLAGTKMPGSEGGTLSQARFNQPLDVLCIEDGLYVSDSYNHVIRLIEPIGAAEKES